MKFEIGDELVNVNNGEKAIVFYAGKYTTRVFNEKGLIYIINSDKFKKTGRRYADIDLLKNVISRYKHVERSTIWPGDEIIYKNINGHERYAVVTNICDEHLVVKNYGRYGCVINKASCVRTNYKFEIDDKILYFINMWQGDDQYIKEENQMTNLEKYTKELDEVQKKLAVLKKKIAAESIEVGDEVECVGSYILTKGIVIHKRECEDEIELCVLCSYDHFETFYTEIIPLWVCTKTGRHFDGLDDLINFFKYNERK